MPAVVRVGPISQLCLWAARGAECLGKMDSLLSALSKKQSRTARAFGLSWRNHAEHCFPQRQNLAQAPVLWTRDSNLQQRLKWKVSPSTEQRGAEMPSFAFPSLKQHMGRQQKGREGCAVTELQGNQPQEWWLPLYIYIYVCIYIYIKHKRIVIIAQWAFKTVKMHRIPHEEGRKKRQLVNMLCMLRLVFQQAAGCCRRL